MNVLVSLLLLLFSFNVFAADVAAHVVSVDGVAWTQQDNKP
jgi:hypothetical protein